MLVEKFRDVDSLNRAGNRAEIRKRRIAAADAGQAEENVAEAARLGHLLHVRAGVGDGDEVLPGLRRADHLLHALEEILLEDIRLKRAAGLARHDENRFREIELALPQRLESARDRWNREREIPDSPQSCRM